MKSEKFHREFLVAAVRRHSVKALNWRYQLFFLVSAIGKKQRLYFFPFHTFPLVDVDVSNEHNDGRALAVVVMIAFFRYMNWSNKKNFSVMFHLHSCSSYFLFLSTKSIRNSKIIHSVMSLEGSSEKFC